MSTITVATCQITARADEAENLAVILPMLDEAADAGAGFVCLPEYANRVDPDRKALLASSTTEADNTMLAALCDKARELGLWLSVGSLMLRHETIADALVNRCFLIAPEGSVFARYDKIHMFDVEVGDGQHYHESASFTAGDKAVLADMGICRIGLTICYDVRFTHLYRRLAQAGAELITIPSAFTQVTGEAHWHSLLRARAIENGVFVVAAAQCGLHVGGRRTYGHALVVDPWGEVISDAGTEPNVAIATLELDKVAQARKAIPSLANDQGMQTELVRYPAGPV